VPNLPGFRKICSGIQKLIRGEFMGTQTHRQHDDLISLLLFISVESEDDSTH
jgi:hypothetical protein